MLSILVKDKKYIKVKLIRIGGIFGDFRLLEIVLFRTNWVRKLGCFQ